MQDKLHKADWYVADADPKEALQMIEEQHYARGGSPVYAYVHGLYHVTDPGLWGVAWWRAPLKQSAVSVAKMCGADFRKVLDLSRLVVDPEVPGNGASFLLGRSEKLIRRDGRFDAFVTFADTFRGHTGAIYKATNWEYIGTTKPEPIWIDPETGRQVSKKQDKRSYRVAEMEAMGYVRIGNSIKNKFIKCLRRKRSDVVVNPRNDYPDDEDIIKNWLYIADYLDKRGMEFHPAQVTQLVIRSLGLEGDPQGTLLVEQVIEEMLE